MKGAKGTADVRGLMAALGSKSLRRTAPIIVYAGPNGYALEGYAGGGTRVYTGEASAVRMAARRELAAVSCMTGARADALVSAGGGLVEIVQAADPVGGEGSPKGLDLVGASSAPVDPAVFSWTARAAAKGDARPILTSVAVELVAGGKGTRYVAADNHRLHVAYGPGGEGYAPADRSALVPATLAGFLKGAKGLTGTWYGPEPKASGLLIEGDGLAVRVEGGGNSFLAWQSAIPGADKLAAEGTAQAEGLVLAIESSARAAALDVAKTGGTAPVELTLAAGPKGLALAAHGGEDVARLAIVECGPVTGSHAIVVQRPYVLDALKGAAGPVAVRLHEEGRPMILAIGGGEKLAIIMPMRAKLDALAVGAVSEGAAELVAAGA